MYFQNLIWGESNSRRKLTSDTKFLNAVFKKRIYLHKL